MTHFKLKRCTNAPAHRATISIRHGAYSTYSEHEQFYMHMTTCNRGAKRTATLESEHKKCQMEHGVEQKGRIRTTSGHKAKSAQSLDVKHVSVQALRHTHFTTHEYPSLYDSQASKHGI